MKEQREGSGSGCAAAVLSFLRFAGNSARSFPDTSGSCTPIDDSPVDSPTETSPHGPFEMASFAPQSPTLPEHYTGKPLGLDLQMAPSHILVHPML